LSLLLKLSPLVDELVLYDVVNTPGVAADLSHISSNAVSYPLTTNRYPNTVHRIVSNVYMRATRKLPATCPLMAVSRLPSRMPM
jgi:hypothetical protein